MTDTPPSSESNFWPEWIKPKRIGEFVKNVLKLENSVEKLKDETERHQGQVDRLQIQVEVLTARSEDQIKFIQAIASRDSVIVEKTIIDQLSDKNKNNK